MRLPFFSAITSLPVRLRWSARPTTCASSPSSHERCDFWLTANSARFSRPFDWTGGQEEYWARVERKTASLFTTAAVSGAVLGGATEAEINAVTEYGMTLGTAFQVVDDILDLQGDASEVGKPIGSDLRGGILTLPALLYLNDHPELNETGPFARLRDDRETMSEQDKEECVEEALALIRNSDAVDSSYALANLLAERARKSLQKVNRPANPALQSLTDIIDFVVQRNS